MQRYANRNRDMMGFEPPIQQAPYMPSKLEPKDERLIEQSEEIGFLKGQNDLLVEDNVRLEDENRRLKERNQELADKVRKFEQTENFVAGSIDSEHAIVREIKKVIEEVKGKKK